MYFSPIVLFTVPSVWSRHYQNEYDVLHQDTGYFRQKSQYDKNKRHILWGSRVRFSYDNLIYFVFYQAFDTAHRIILEHFCHDDAHTSGDHRSLHEVNPEAPTLKIDKLSSLHKCTMICIPPVPKPTNSGRLKLRWRRRVRNFTGARGGGKGGAPPFRDQIFIAFCSTSAVPRRF